MRYNVIQWSSKIFPDIVQHSLFKLETIQPGGPASCHGPASPSSLPPSVPWIVQVMIVVHAYYELFIHCHINLMCLCNSVMLFICPHAIYCFCPSWRGILLCCSPEGVFPFFLFERVLFFIFGEFILIRCEVLGQGCRMCTNCKALLRQICNL